MKKTLLTGIKPTGLPHIGNYFGMMKQAIDLQHDHNSYVFIADLHALTSVSSKKELEDLTLNVALDYIACGLDPKHTVFYKQSDAPQVAELAWIFNCLTTMPYLMRAHAFKDAEAKNKDINVGVFEYPILMAADILLPQAHIVPVGQDQKQHVEIARDTAEKFNRIYGEYFTLPEAYILPDVQTVPGIDGRKMSKSYGNIIPLFAEDDVLKKQVMSIVTDSKGVTEPKDPATCNVFAIYKLFASKEEQDALAARYTAGGIGYKEAKELVLAKVIEFVAPKRAKRKELEQDVESIKKILRQNGERVRGEFEIHMSRVRDLVGIGKI